MAQHYANQNVDTRYTKIYVGGLPWKTRNEGLRSYFQQFGEIIHVNVVCDRETGRSDGYGFVTFRDAESATSACQNPKPVIDGREAKCNLAYIGARVNNNQNAQQVEVYVPNWNQFQFAPQYDPYTPCCYWTQHVESEKENLREFSFTKLSKATKKFRQYMVIKGNDSGCTRTFYQGYINETTFAPSRTGIAVFVLECFQDNSQTLQDWKEEVKSLGRMSHPNLVKLLGYCCEENKSFLVFEYLHKGSLDRHIFGKEEETLPCETRVKIAIGAAQSIAFLHSVKNSALYRELRMYNILLDENYNTKLFYLGSKKLCLLEESVTTAFIGRTVYLAPEYAISGHLGTKSDVYTFGVILFEILTGLKASDGKKNENMQSLHVWTKPFLSDQSKIREIIDPRLGNDYPVNAATQMGKLIKRCIKLDMRKRPSMQQVFDGLNDIAEIKD